MKAIFAIAPLALIVSACGAEPADGEIGDSSTIDSQNPDTVVEGPEGDETLAEIELDPNWTTRVSPDVPYNNRLEAPVSVYANADGNSEVIGEIAPGEGGMVRNCALNSDFCELEYGSARTGWVNIGDFEEGAM